MPTPIATTIACRALEALRQQLAQRAPMAGGHVTPALLQAVADDCPEAVVVTDHRARIRLVNGVAARLLGTSARELQQLTIWDITHPTFQSDFDILWREFLRARRQRGQYGMRHRDGSVVDVGYCGEADVLPDRTVIVLRRLG